MHSFRFILLTVLLLQACTYQSALTDKNVQTNAPKNLASAIAQQQISEQSKNFKRYKLKENLTLDEYILLALESSAELRAAFDQYQAQHMVFKQQRNYQPCARYRNQPVGNFKAIIRFWFLVIFININYPLVFLDERIQ